MVVVGSGPAGAAVARHLALRGVRVLVVEEGHEAPLDRLQASGVRAMASLYRDMGTSIAFGNASMPYLQGCAVGGTSVVNGAISWRFPPEVLAEWARDDPALGEALDPAAVGAAEDRIEARLHVHPTEERVAGPKNLLLARGAEVLGVAHRPIRRNVDGCVGEGRCLQGCPHGHKLSMDRSFLPDAVEAGARILAGMRVTRVIVERGVARGVAGVSTAGARFEVRARCAVVLAASAVQTPCLLLRSGLAQGPVGAGLAAHPGVSVTGRFPEPVRAWRGATQGHEVTGYRAEGIKLEALGFDISLLASRVPDVGERFAHRLVELDRYACWGAALRAEGRGRVRPGRMARRRPIVTLLARRPATCARRAAACASSANRCSQRARSRCIPGVPGFDAVVRDRAADGALRAGRLALRGRLHDVDDAPLRHGAHGK